jgi:hypothetical protein
VNVSNSAPSPSGILSRHFTPPRQLVSQGKISKKPKENKNNLTQNIGKL